MNADNEKVRSPIPDDELVLAVEVFRMLADATRVQVLWALADAELSVNELADYVGKPAPSVSQHLAKLRMARLVRTRRSGTTVYYSIGNDHVRQLITDAIHNAEHAGPDEPPHHRPEAEIPSTSHHIAGENSR
ncbi:ArsR/SmtB family transcription factor [Nocardia cyriacigeorgica]|uniref:ArsR/SmtB family transcription factor n=1 Tax=Nocardia cyriacigeorgica TaxID=135487 RepID=UPI001894F5C0|nr:metalloregulator ArsR/SmtB family transcription factor [Nocardia cyriacigeorgica]MBF6439592.1 helix-turn-helix transcriptional regulator [Nocardia cyriacigeorgica]